MGANLLMYAQGQMEWDDVVSNAVETGLLRETYKYC